MPHGRGGHAIRLNGQIFRWPRRSRTMATRPRRRCLRRPKNFGVENAMPLGARADISHDVGQDSEACGIRRLNSWAVIIMHSRRTRRGFDKAQVSSCIARHMTQQSALLLMRCPTASSRYHAISFRIGRNDRLGAFRRRDNAAMVMAKFIIAGHIAFPAGDQRRLRRHISAKYQESALKWPHIMPPARCHQCGNQIKRLQHVMRLQSAAVHRRYFSIAIALA